MKWIKFSKPSRQYRENTSQKISWGHWFAFFNIIWAIIIGSRYAFLIDWPDTLVGKLYFFLSLLGHFSFTVFVCYLLVLFPLSFIIKNDRTFRGISVILATISITLLLFDSEIFARFNLHLSAVVWSLFINPENGELARNWQIFFAPMPFILLLQMIYSRWSWQKLRSLERQKWLRPVGFVFVLCFFGTHLFYAWSDAVAYRPITMQKSNFPLSYPMTARTFLEKHGFLNKEEYEITVAEQGRLDALKLDYPKHKLQTSLLTSKPNILLINISGLRYDAIMESKMPNLAEFAKHSHMFINHYSTGNNSDTGLTGLFYGLNAIYTDSLLNAKISSPWIEALKQQGYKLGVFVNQSQPNILLNSIFQSPLQASRSNQSAVSNWQVWQNKHLEKPWFSYISLDARPQYEIDNLPDEGQEIVNYEQNLQTVDTQLAAVLKTIEPLLDQTLVIITSDQGYAYQLNATDKNDYFAIDAIQVPLIIRGLENSIQQDSKLTSHTDIMPTVMTQLLGVENPMTDFSQGENLFEEERHNDWVLVGNYHWNVIIQPNGLQHHISRRGRYRKYNVEYEKESSKRPPLGLFLEVFSQNQRFFDK